MKKMKIGKLHKKGSLLLRQRVGDAKGKVNSFEMSLSTDRSPLIECNQTGKYYSLSWSDIIKLAEMNGILEDVEPVEGVMG